MTDVNETLAERKKTHGEYTEHARCTQAIMDAVMRERNWCRLTPIQKESIHMFAHKMGRISVGNPDEPDHWRDIAGYAVLVEQRLAKPKPPLTGEAAGVAREHGWWDGVGADVRERPRSAVKFDPVENDTIKPRTPEDGGQHASLAPWVVSSEWLLNNRLDVPVDLMNPFWRERTSTLRTLEPYVLQDRLPLVLQSCYSYSGHRNTLGWILRIEDCPPDAREYFPSFAREKNMMELSELPQWQQDLYEWDAQGSKHVLRPKFEAWHTEEE